jgi:hypothetical protein
MHFDDGETIVCPLGTESIVSNAGQSTYATPSGLTRTVTNSGDSRSTSSQNDSTLQGQFDKKNPDPIVGTGSLIPVIIDGGNTSGPGIGNGSTSGGQGVRRGGKTAQVAAAIQKGFTRLLRRK